MSHLGKDRNNNVVPVLTPSLTQAILTTGVASVASAAVAVGCTLVEIYSPVDCFYTTGADPVAVIVPGLNGRRLRAETPRIIQITPGHKVAFILTAGASTAEVTEMR